MIGAAVEPARSRFVLPDPNTAGPDDLLAVGADLAPGTLLQAYRKGVFPMPDAYGRLAWWSPWWRGVVPLDRWHESRSLRRSRRRYRVSIDQDCQAVISACADPARSGRWITPEIDAAYLALHHLGWVHSVEAWDDQGELVGGLYGVAIGGLFAGESMFHRSPDASKVALAHLVDRMRAGEGARLLDVQWATPHLVSLGAIEISRPEYLDRLRTAMAVVGPWGGGHGCG